MRTSFFALGLVLLVTVASWAVDPATGSLQPGDKVEVKWAGEPVTAEFVEYTANGWIRVKFLREGVAVTPVLPPQDVRVLEDGANRAEKKSKRPLRTWTDKTGKFKTKARFVELDGDALTLETDEGKTLSIPLEKLSEADQAVARKVAAKTARPADSASGSGTRGPSSGAVAPMASAPPSRKIEPPPLATADWSTCRTIESVSPPAWAVPIDGGPAPGSLTAQPIAVPFATNEQGSRFFEKIGGLLFARDAARACVMVSSVEDMARAPALTLSFVDLKEGKVDRSIVWPTTLRPIELARSGRTLLALSDSVFSRGSSDAAVGVWKIGGKSIEAVNAWNPNPPGILGNSAPQFASFIDDDHVLCSTMGGNASMWNVAEAKAVWQMEVSQIGKSVAVSPGGKLVAAANWGGVWVLDSMTGSPLGRLEGQVPPDVSLSFRPDGGQLAAVSPNRLLIWDLTTGGQFCDIPIRSATPLPDSVDWLFGGCVLVGGRMLVDLERRVVLWSYATGGQGQLGRNQGELGGRYWYTDPGRAGSPHALYSVLIPHDNARRTAAALDAEKLLVVRPGTPFSLDVRVEGSVEEQENVRQAITKGLESAGMTVADGQPLVVQATTEVGASREITYRKAGSIDRQGDKATTTDQICRLTLVENGKQIWESILVNGPPITLRIKEGETAQQALASYRKTPSKIFERMQIPRYIAREAEAGAYGFSTITSQGVVDVAPPTNPANGK